MKKYSCLVSFFLVSLHVNFCLSQTKLQLIDKQATPETVNLFLNLHELSKEHILFGHQHATEYGHGWFGDSDRSDVKSVTGSHPAVIGVDFSGLSGRPDSSIEKTKIALRKTIADTYNRGGVVTVAWHFSNPIAGGRFLLERFCFTTCGKIYYSG